MQFYFNLNLANHSILLVLTSILILPSTNFITFPQLFEYDNKRVIEIILIFCCLFLILSTANFRRNKLPQLISLPLKIRLTLLFLFLIMVLSSFFSTSPSHAFLEGSLFTGLFFFSLVIAQTSNSLGYFPCFIYITISFSCLLYQTSFFTGYLASFIENIPLQWPEPFTGFSNIRFFNQYQIWSISLLALPLLIYSSLDKRLASLLKLISVGWAILLFASASRGAIGSIMSAMALSYYFFKGYAKPLIKLNSIILLAGFIGYLLLFKFIPTLFENKVSSGWLAPAEVATTTSGRTELWLYAIQYIKDNPWLGIGPMHYAYFPGPSHAHPHNSLLQWACEMGIPSTLLLISLVYSGLSAWVKKFHRLQQNNKLYISTHLWVGLFCSLCSGLIYSMVSGVIVMPLSQIMMCLIAGWMLGIYFQDQTIKACSQKQHITFMLVAGATLITLTYTVLPSLLPRLFGTDLALQNYPTIAPRFWQIGGIPH